VKLVENAIKFTERGKVDLRVKVASALPDGCELQFSVADTGCGIPAEKMDVIFHAFEQADTSSRRHHGGTGLGLALATRLVQLMGGRIWAESSVGRGSTFYFVARFGVTDQAGQFSVPKRLGAEPVAPSRDEPTAAAAVDDGLPLRILLAEDNRTNQAYAVRTLEKQGHAVVVASNGEEALEAWKREPFDIVLMDLQMPGVDGYQATATIRQAEAATGRRLPIIAVTAHADRDQCLAAGMDGFVSKPIRAKALFAEIDRLTISRQRVAAVVEVGTSTMESSVEAAPGADVELPVFDRAELLERVNHDAEFLIELIELFKEDYVTLLASIREAAARRDSPALAGAAHKFKGMVGNFCAEPATQAARQLEDMVKDGNLDDVDVHLECVEREAHRLRAALELLAEGT
jgi:CheY-like chemotaxis protein